MRPAQAFRAVPVILSLAWCLLMLNASALAKPEPGRGELIAGTPSGPVARFYPAYFTDGDRVASFSLQREFARGGDLPANYAVTPLFEKLADGRHRLRIQCAPGTSFYGTGEVPGTLLRSGRRTILWNTDAYGYNFDAPSLYQSHPWVLAVRPDGSTFGVLADTTWRTEINLLDNVIEFVAEGKPFPVYVVDRPRPEGVLSGLRDLTGPMPLPPLWALGYHQCRYSYYPEARVREIATEFRKRKIPASVIWFDIDYMDGYRTFTFDKTHFPDPKKLNTDLQAMGFKTIWMINPGIKDEPGYFIRDQLVSAGFEVKDRTGATFRGGVWPGMCVFPDYTNHEVRAWWSGLYREFMAMGIDGVWNDMNEPAVFNVASKTMPEDNQHRGGLYAAIPGGPAVKVTPGDHARFHNVYGMLMALGTYEGILAANPGKRPFVLTRAGHLGSHRYAATWTGDNTANWFDLESSIGMVLNLGLSGQPFSGPDIGGFNGNGPSTDAKERAEHFARWMGIGALLPFSRGHTGKGNIDKEPWSFGEDTERACRLALQRRYRLLAHFYSLFHEASETGVPVMRPVFFADPADPALRSEDDAFLLGGDILVVAQLQPDRTRRVVLPSGTWRPFDVVEGSHPANPDLFLRGGAIVPVIPLTDGHSDAPIKDLTLLVSLDANGAAAGKLYEDAYDGFGYQKGDFLLTQYAAKREGDTLTVSIAKTEGSRARPDRPLTVRVVLDGGAVVEGKGIDGKPVTVKLK